MATTGCSLQARGPRSSGEVTRAGVEARCRRMTGHGDGPQLRPVSPPQPSTVIQTAYAMTNPASASSTQSLIDNLGWRLI